jgi:3-phosphoglycerate kinase
MTAVCYTSRAIVGTIISLVSNRIPRRATTRIRLEGVRIIVNTLHFGDPTDAISRIASIEPVLRVLRRVTGLRVVLVARVTDTSWTACAVLDDAEFGLKPGDQLELSHTY